VILEVVAATLHLLGYLDNLVTASLATAGLGLLLVTVGGVAMFRAGRRVKPATPLPASDDDCLHVADCAEVVARAEA
jgi:hypothetical protein